MLDPVVLWRRLLGHKKVAQYPLSWVRSNGARMRSIGMEIAPSYLVFATVVPPSPTAFEVEFSICKKIMRAQVAPIEAKLVRNEKSYYYRMVCKIVTISTEDWEYIARFVDDKLEIKNPIAATDPIEDEADEFRSLPMGAQNQIVSDLVKKGLLHDAKANVAPLIKIVEQEDEADRAGKKQKRFLIHSRAFGPSDNAIYNYQTRYAVDDTGTVRRPIPSIVRK